MPTFQTLSLAVETDLGWAVARPVRDLAGGVVAVDLTCKSCGCAMRYAIDRPIFSRFNHAADCRVLLEVKATSEPWLKRAPHN